MPESNLILLKTQELVHGSPEEMSSLKNWSRLLHLWKFVQPDLALTLTGIALYGLIGGTYPIMGAILADINVVCLYYNLMSWNVYHVTVTFLRNSVKTTGIQFWKFQGTSHWDSLDWHLQLDSSTFWGYIIATSKYYL